MQYLFGVILYVLMAAAWFRIFKRLGWPGWWGLAMVIPPLIFILSFQKWPIERRLQELEEELDRLGAR